MEIAWFTALVCAICLEGLGPPIPAVHSVRCLLLPQGCRYLPRIRPLPAVCGGPTLWSSTSTAGSYSSSSRHRLDGRRDLQSLAGGPGAGAPRLRSYWLWWFAPPIVASALRRPKLREQAIYVLVAVSLGVAALAAVQFASPADSSVNMYSVWNGEEVYSADMAVVPARGEPGSPRPSPSRPGSVPSRCSFRPCSSRSVSTRRPGGRARRPSSGRSSPPPSCLWRVRAARSSRASPSCSSRCGRRVFSSPASGGASFSGRSRLPSSPRRRSRTPSSACRAGSRTPMRRPGASWTMATILPPVALAINDYPVDRNRDGDGAERTCVVRRREPVGRGVGERTVSDGAWTDWVSARLVEQAWPHGCAAPRLRNPEARRAPWLGRRRVSRSPRSP